MEGSWTHVTLPCIRRLVPDKLMRTRSVPRTVSVIFLSGLTMLAALLNAGQRLEFLGLASLLSGFAFGGFQGVVPAITSEIFGLRNFATNYAMVQLGPAAGELLRPLAFFQRRACGQQSSTKVENKKRLCFLIGPRAAE